MPNDDKDDDNGDGETRMEALAVGVGTTEVLGELAAIGLYIGGVVHVFAALKLFFTFGFCHEAVELVFAFAGVDVYAAEATGFTG